MATEKNEAPKRKLSAKEWSQALGIFKYIRPYQWHFWGSMVFLALSSLVFFLVMALLGKVLDILGGRQNVAVPNGLDTFIKKSSDIFGISIDTGGMSINMVFFSLFLVLVVQGFFSYMRMILGSIVTEKSIADLRKDLFQKLVCLDIPFFEKNRVGELSSRLTNDVSQLQNVIGVILPEFVRQLVFLIGGVIVLAVMMPKLAGIMLATFLPVVGFAMWFGRSIRTAMKGRQDKLAETNIVVEEALQSINSVKAYTNESFEIARYTKSLNEVVVMSLKAGKLRGMFAAFIITALFGALFFVMWVASNMVASGSLTIGDLTNFVLFTGLIGGAIAALGNFYTEMVSAVGATERVREILEIPNEVEIGSAQNVNSERFNGNIEYKDIAFNYPTRPDMEVLKGFNLHIRPGQKIALVGQSGSGKSTIVQLLLRFHKAQSGQLMVDGQKAEDYNITHYRTNMAIVPQEVLLFGGTIGENIAYGKPNATPQELEAAARKANAWDFISQFPDGLQTLVGERGIKLSGGQRQRIAIARAILKDPAILILDEATSSLDAESEKVVQDALDVLMEGRTSIIIAHRLSTIKDVDCIYVLEKGQIIESGTHHELMTQDGVYASLAKLQYE